MSTQEELLSVPVEIEHAVTMGKALEHLNNCPHFKALILDGFLKEKALASVSLLAVPQIKDAGRRADVMEDLVAASNLQYFFLTVEQDYEGTFDPVLSDDELAEAEGA